MASSTSKIPKISSVSNSGESVTEEIPSKDFRSTPRDFGGSMKNNSFISFYTQSVPTLLGVKSKK